MNIFRLVDEFLFGGSKLRIVTSVSSIQVLVTCGASLKRFLVFKEKGI